jgi:hypothetical protein
MASIIHPCPHCSQPAKLETDQLPDQSVAYPCPHCKESVTVEKRLLLAQTEAPATPPQQPAAAQSSASDKVTLAKTPQAERRFSDLPEETQLPSGIIVGDDSETVQKIQSRLAAAGSSLEIVESMAAARQAILNEDPELCIFVVSGELNPQSDPLSAVNDLPPVARRHSYFALVGDNLETMDGAQAFIFQVNMVLGKQDLEHCEAALHSGLEYHRRLFRPYQHAVKRKHSAA